MSSGYQSYTPAHTIEQLAALLDRDFSSRVAQLVRVDYGVINAVYATHLENGLECFIKVAPNSRGEHRLREEIWAFERCRAVGVPTPEVLAFSPEPGEFPEPYHITRRIGGDNGEHAGLAGEARLDVLRQLGAYLARIHSVPLDGFGLLHAEGDTFAGQHPSLWQSMTHELHDSWWHGPVLHAGLATPAQLLHLRHLFEQNRRLFEVDRACLVYADAGLRNLIVRDGRVVGLVDFENVVAAEPVNDFDGLHYDGPDEFAAVRDGYGRPELFDADFTRKLALYRLLFAFPRLAYHHWRGQSDAVAATQARIRALEAEIDAW